MSENKTDLTDLYNKVFGNLGDVKPCGRDACITLMEALHEYYPDVDFGNLKNGFMNVPTVKQYYKKYCKEYIYANAFNH